MTETYLILAMAAVVLAVAALLLRKREGYMPAVIILVALAAPFLSGQGFRPREVVEGAFAYLDVAMWMLMGGLLVALLYQNGTFEYLLNKCLNRKLSNQLKLMELLFWIGVPGMLTGSALASAATTGVLAARMLKRRGLPRAKAVEIAAAGSFLGMVLPPLCAPAMLMVLGRAGSYNPSFEGYFVPLLAAGLPALIVYGLTCGQRLLGEMGHDTQEAPAGSAACLLPLAVVFVLVIAHNFLFMYLPFLGYPVIYLIGFLLAAVIAPRRVNPLTAALDGPQTVLLPAALMFAAGSLNEVFWLTGVTGNLSTAFVQAPDLWLFIVPVAAIFVLARVLGQPFGWALAALAPTIINGAGYQLSPLRLMAAGIILAAASYRSLLGTATIPSAIHARLEGDEESLALPVASCVPVMIAVILSLVIALVPLDMLMI
ncbi:MAG: TRAP transporter large permease subunit [Christensenellales bacterium]